MVKPRGVEGSSVGYCIGIAGAGRGDCRRIDYEDGQFDKFLAVMEFFGRRDQVISNGISKSGDARHSNRPRRANKILALSVTTP
jgi:hypothetical protein